VEYAVAESEELSAWSLKVLDNLDEAAHDRMRIDERRFRAYQEAVDAEEAVASIPSLSIHDIPTQVETIPTRKEELEQVPFYSLDVFSNGIVYIDIVFDVQDVSGNLLPYFPLFCRAVSGAGLPGIRYDEIARQLAIKTGGFASYLEVNSVDGYGEQEPPPDGNRSRAFVVFRLKALDTSLHEAVELVASLITQADFSDRGRIKDILLEFRNDVRSQIIPSGSSFAALRAGSRLSPVLAREEVWKGVEQALFLYRIADQIDERIDEVCGALEDLRRRIITRDRLTLNLTADGDVHGEAKQAIGSFIRSLPQGPGAEATFRLPSPEDGPRLESLVAPSMVGFVSTAFSASSFREPEHAHEVLAAQLLKTDYLWEQVRMKGGAYGVSASANGGELLFGLSSYRDPNIAATLDAFKNGFDWLLRSGTAPANLEKAIINIVGRDLRPLSPGEKGIIGFRRRLYDIPDGLRQRKRNELLRSTPAHIREAAERLKEFMEASYTVVLTGAESLQNLPSEYRALAENRVDFW
jgi:Zn-dependent M16 (insulinase) family peptidase